MVCICEAVVAKVVTDGRDQHRQGVQLTQLRPLLHASFCEEEVAHLQDVKRVHFIVVLDLSPVALVYLAHESRQLHLIELLEFVDVENLEYVDGHDRKCRFTTELSAEF